MKNMYYLYFSIKNRFSLKIDFFGALCLSILTMLLTSLYFKSFFNYTSSLGGLNKYEIIILYLTSTSQVMLVNSFTYSIYNFFHEVQQGKIEPIITKPISIYVVMFFRWFSIVQFILFVITIISLLLYIHFTSELYIRQNKLLVFCMYYLIGFILNICYITIMESLTYILKRQIQTAFIFSELSRIMQIPLLILPQKLIYGLVIFFPAIISSALATNALFHESFYMYDYLSLLTTIVTISITIYLHNILRSKFNGHGG